MAHRTFRLSISPEDRPEVRRLIELDGRATLAQLHLEAARAYGLSLDDEPYAFFLSGRFWDEATAYWDPRADGRGADRALLFRSGLSVGKSFAYLLGFKHERRFLIEVQAVTEVAEPLTSPVLVESQGEYGAETPEADALAPDKDPPDLAALVPLAEAFLDFDDQLDPFADELAVARAQSEPWADPDAALGELSAFKLGQLAPPAVMRDAVPIFLKAAAAALTLVEALQGDAASFLRLDEWLLSRALGTRLLDLPFGLAAVGETEVALKIARAMVFIDPELIRADIAVILARAGQREAALAQIDELITNARDAALVEAKAGDTYRALGDAVAAEAYYRRSLAVSKTSSDRLHALLRLVTCLIDAGREAEARDVLAEARRERGEPEPARNSVVVGRNERCPCGSGKKYKKCHGA